MFRRLAPLACALSLSACLASDNSDSGLIVLDNTATAMGAVSCTFTGDPAQPFISQGQITALSPQPYLLTPLIESRISALMGQDPSTRTIELQGADVTLKVASGTATLPETAFQSVFSGFVTPGGTTNVTMPLVPVDDLMAINSALGTASGSVVLIASVTVKGLLGGDVIKSLPFQYGVTVCTNCVVNNLGPCSMVTGTVRLGNPCNVFQDGIVDCCMNTSGVLVCPASMQ